MRTTLSSVVPVSLVLALSVLIVAHAAPPDSEEIPMDGILADLSSRIVTMEVELSVLKEMIEAFETDLLVVQANPALALESCVRVVTGFINGLPGPTD